MSHPEAAYCGDYCGKCDHFGATCAGCNPLSRVGCPFISCCQEKAIAHCGLCSEFPCEKLETFVPDDRKGCPKGYHIENLRNRQIVGTQAWLEVQRGKWGK